MTDVYWIWQAEMRYWRNANVMLDLDHWNSTFPPLTMTCQSVKEKLPALLTYSYRPATAPITDLLWSASHYDLYSPRAVQLLDQFQVGYESVPSVVRTTRSNTLLTDYRFVHIIHCESGLDWKSSDVDSGRNQLGANYVRHARRLVLTREIETRNIPVFRLEEMKSLTLVSEEFRAQWERHRLTGALFRSLERYPEP